MRIKIIIAVLITVIVTSCFLESDDLTIVKGKVTNKIDGTNVSGLPIELSKCTGRFFNGSTCDSLKTVYTDSEGNYSLDFRTERKYYYKIRVAGNTNYESSYEGVTVDEGKTNSVDFKLMPYTTLKVNLKTSKSNKNYLQIDFVQAQCSGGWSGWAGGMLLLDTARVNQSIDTAIHLSVFPLCDYRFMKSLCNRSGIAIQDYKYTDCTDYETMQTFHVNYTDTTEIELN